MNQIRYFTNGRSIWRFEDGCTPQIRSVDSAVWRASLFPTLAQFLAEPEDIHETTPEEAEGPARLHHDYFH